MTCLVCCGPLTERGNQCYTCDLCGYFYTAEAMAALGEEWGEIQRRGLACARCPGLPGLPKIHMNRRGKPVKCRWWRRRKVKA